MKALNREILRDPINLFFGLGFPLVLLFLLSAIQASIPVSLFEIERLAPGISVFGLSFITLFTATLVSSFLFAYFHRTGAAAGGIACVNFFLFGMLASLFMIRFGSLFGAAALHAGWNIGQALLLGSPVSGEVFPTSFGVFLPAEGGTLISGGTFGLEGGIAVTCLFTLGVAILGMVRTKED